MALDFSGIDNVGEFYSGHYLSAVLDSDLKSTFAKWKHAKEEEGQRLPNEALAGLSNRYFTARGKAEEERDPAERLSLAQDVHAYLLEALGYSRQPGLEPLEGDRVVPVHLALQRDGHPYLWVLDAPFPAEEDEDPLAASPLPEQLEQAGAEGASLPGSTEDKSLPATWRELLDEQIFHQERSPRWVLFLSGSEVLLIKRDKWPQGQYLRFDLDDLFGRKQAGAMRAMAGLLHRDVLAPEAGLCLHDTLDENSHKHAYAVSSDLKHGVRRAVELLANEAVYYRREVQKQGVFNEEELASQLTSDCLSWLYRLLFLFFVEARGSELEAVPMKSDAYRKGYSLESLRDLEQVPLTTEHAQNGYFLHDSLKILFRILNMGFPELEAEEGGSEQLGRQMLTGSDMWIDALNSPLFDDDRMEILKGVKFRNRVLQEILQLMSLSAEKKRKDRGRISYAQLGINQLGAVYEGLLSYTGFFATEDLYEVASEKDCEKLSGKPAAEREALKTYFVPASKIGDYKEGEIVKDENERKVVHPKGSFIFRMAGRNREKSASYYTPEVLTQCLVKYALKELLWEEGEEGAKPTPKKTADEILALTICEPAMGSSAFLIEAVDQLADAYLEAKQEELGETIAPEDYQREKRRVMARLATNNCYGVDLNPTAVELAKVSLWLATLHEDGKCPWFGLRLATGNSLVGARREVFKTADVTRKGTKDAPNWLGLVPEPVPLHHSPEEGDDAPSPDEVDWANWTAPPRPKGTIYHFLLPAEGMAAFDKDKVIKQLAPESVKRIKEWRKEFCKPFNKKDAEHLEQISDAVDRLFAQVVRERVLATQETSDRIPVWGEPPSAQQADLLVRDQEEVAASLEDGSSAYRRLKLAMDAWCALWFWPIEEAGLLPDRATWLAQMELILAGRVTQEEVWQQQGLFAELSARESQHELAATEVRSGDGAPLNDVSAQRLKRLRALSDAFRERRADYFNECGLSDVQAVLEEDASLRAARRIADQLHFQHWHLRFAEVFATRGGFDLVLGNPPWVLLSFDEKALFSDFDATIAVRKISPALMSRYRGTLLDNESTVAAYTDEFRSQYGAQSYLGDRQNFPLLLGMKTNLYKCFISQSWRIGNADGVAGLLHPDGPYDDPHGAKLREGLYPRLVFHFHMRNALKLFSEVHDLVMFGLNVYRCRPRVSVDFLNISNLVHPNTIQESFLHDGRGETPGIKNADGDWDLRGHSGRVVRLSKEDLQLFAALYCTDDQGAPNAQLPIMHSRPILEALRKIAVAPRLGPVGTRWGTTREWNEGDRQPDGTIVRQPSQPSKVNELIVSGPHFFVGNPLYKTPNETCQHNQDFTGIDLASIRIDYLPRTVFVAGCEQPEYLRRTPRWRDQPIFNYYRHANRKMIAPTGERTLVPAIIPAGVGSTGGVLTAAFENNHEMIVFNSLCTSLVADFFVKSMGKTNLNAGELQILPTVDGSHAALEGRCLRLNCLTSHYADLWSEMFVEDFPRDAFTSRDRRLSGWGHLTKRWDPRCAVRSDFERRLSLVEIDVLASIALGLSRAELLAVYLVQFPVLQEYERERLYDQSGRVVPSAKTASGSPAVSLVELAATLKEQAGFDVHAEYHPDGSNTQELRKQKVRLGKKEADVLGVSERCTMADLLAETEVRWSGVDHPEGRPVRLVGLCYTDPGLEPRMERVYPTPWTRCDREADYRQAWAEFERRLGKKMPEGTALDPSISNEASTPT